MEKGHKCKINIFSGFQNNTFIINVWCLNHDFAHTYSVVYMNEGIKNAPLHDFSGFQETIVSFISVCSGAFRAVP